MNRFSPNEPYKILYTTGATHFEGSTINWKRCGRWREYSIDGQLVTEIFFKNEQKNGLYKIYQDNKPLLCYESFYINDKQHGLEIENK